MRIIVTSATEMETESLRQTLNANYSLPHSIDYHVSGVGVLCTTYSLTKLLLYSKPDLIIQTGIAGAYNTSVELGKVMIMQSDALGNTGVLENEEWKDIFDTGFIAANRFPFTEKKLINPWLNKLPVTLPVATGITIDEITTDKNRIDMLKNKYNADTESMEGAPFHYVCLQQNVPFMQIRGISNYVRERNKGLWKIKEALHNTTEEIARFLKKL